MEVAAAEEVKSIENRPLQSEHGSPPPVGEEWNAFLPGFHTYKPEPFAPRNECGRSGVEKADTSCSVLTAIYVVLGKPRTNEFYARPEPTLEQT